MLQQAVRAHGGQGATAGAIAAPPQINAVFRGTTRMIRVWDGHGDAEEFTVEEARDLCVRGDQALLDGWIEFGRTRTGMWIGDERASEIFVCDRQWLIAFLAVVRRALRTADMAQALAPNARRLPIDDESDPGSWDRHLRHTADMRGANA